MMVTQEGRDGPAFPRLRHWAIAAGLLFLATQAVPVMAGLT